MWFYYYIQYIHVLYMLCNSNTHALVLSGYMHVKHVIYMVISIIYQ